MVGNKNEIENETEYLLQLYFQKRKTKFTRMKSRKQLFYIHFEESLGIYLSSLLMIRNDIENLNGM